MSKLPSSSQDRVLELTRTLGIIRPRDLESHGIHREYLRRLEKKGLLTRLGRGLYTLADADFSEHQQLAEVSKRVPHGVICLLSALRFHGLTTQAPFEVWLAIDHKARVPKIDTPPVHIIYMSGKALRSGIDTHQIEGVEVPIFNPAKTVVDCFKYRNKIGLDVALESLQDYWQQHQGSIDVLWHYAKICRMGKVMRPYLEFLV